MAKLDVIGGSYVYQRLSTKQLEKLASISQEKTYEVGQTIFREGDQAESFYILEEGKVILEMRIPALKERRPPPLATIEVVTKGEALGWSALVEPHIFTLSATAADRCKLIAIDGTKLLKLMDSDPTMGYEVMRRLSEVIASRLRHTREMLLSERGLALLSQTLPY